MVELESNKNTAVRKGLENESTGSHMLNTFFHFKSPHANTGKSKLKKTRILDPRKKAWQQWNSVFLFSCLAALFIDPLYFFYPVVNSEKACVSMDNRLAIVITVLRTVTDLFHLIHIGVQFRTGYLKQSGSTLGVGELVSDPVQIAKRYLSRNFILDCIAVLPLPQIFIWIIIPGLHGSAADNTKTALRFIILFQLIPRIYPLAQQMGKSTKVHTESAWGGAFYNLLLYMLISHFVGAFYYLLAVERQDTCWRKACKGNCNVSYLDCGEERPQGYLFDANSLNQFCQNTFDFGIYGDALDNGIVSTSKFVDKYFYCLWFGLRNLSTLGQGLNTSSYEGEIIFSIAIIIIGLTLFARLLGNMQSYLQSITLRLEEMRLKRHDMEQWMQHRQIYPELRSRIRKYEEYRWQETRGVNEEELVQLLPKDLRRDIKRHLCLDLVMKVPLFKYMDDQLKDAICENLQPTLFTSGTHVVQEGDPVDEMLFIIRGVLKSVTTNGGRTDFLNEEKLGPGHFCGEELLTWALDPKSGGNFPSSTRSVTAESEVEAFALKAEDLKFVASQYRRLHSKQVQHTFRYHSHTWRTWAAGSIQGAWRRYKKRKLDELQRKQEEENLWNPLQESSSTGVIHASLGAALYASRFAANALRGVHRLRALHAAQEGLPSLKLQKPSEPDFSGDNGD
ncbi:hypothetical protein KP509_13G070300 [Ceratopteris richardii]|nr:hypothetical protein KP509_13G070300 [Ceratopteris richardii]